MMWTAPRASQFRVLAIETFRMLLAGDTATKTQVSTTLENWTVTTLEK